MIIFDSFLSAKITTSYSLLRGIKVEEVQNQLRETMWASGPLYFYFELMTADFFFL